MLKVIQGDGAGVRPAHHFEEVSKTARTVIRHVERGQDWLAAMMARDLSGIERAHVTTCMVRCDIPTDKIENVLCAKERVE